MTLTGCKLINVRCIDGTSDCFLNHALYNNSPQKYYGLFSFDISNGSDGVVNGACVLYTNDNMPDFIDGRFSIARAMAITGLACGILTTLLLLGYKLCCQSKFYMAGTTFFCMCSCLFQSLIFLITQSVAWKNPVSGAYSVLAVTAYLCIASACCFFCAMCCSFSTVLCAGSGFGDDREEFYHHRMQDDGPDEQASHKVGGDLALSEKGQFVGSETYLTGSQSFR